MNSDSSQKTIPKGWEATKIKDLLDYERPDKYIVKNECYANTGKIPVLTANKSFILGYTNEDFGVYKNIPAIIFDDFTTDSKYVDFPFKVKSSAIKILRSKSKHPNLKFLYEIIKSINFIARNHKRYYISEYQNIDVVVPPWEEQKKIAEILSTVDDEIQKTDEIIYRTEKLKKGLAQQLFTKGIGHKKFKKTRIGNIPEKWEAVTLGEIGTNIIGLTYSPKDVVLDGGTLVFRSSNIFGNSIKYGDNVFVNKKIPNHLITKSGDILLCTRNGSRNLIGKNAYIDEGSAGHSFGAFMSIYRTRYSKFVFQFFQSKFFKDQVNQYLGATINQITTKSLNSFVISLPPIDEQDKITKILCIVDQKISKSRALREKLVLLKRGLMSDLLSGKVRVEAKTL